jgi:hypothetical protein
MESRAVERLAVCELTKLRQDNLILRRAEISPVTVLLLYMEKKRRGA